MGCDIHTFVEVRTPEGWVQGAGLEYPILDGRNYGIFGFLADVRNYSHSPVISEPRGLPEDVSDAVRDADDWSDHHSHSWLTLAELLAYDYEQVFWDRRITRDGNGAALAGEGEGEHLTLRAFLGEWFFKELDRLRTFGDPEDVRLVFWFDS
jgi:hypothetical protein